MSEKLEKNELAPSEKQEIDTEHGEPTRTGVYYAPQVDIYETPEGITLLADLPGVDKADLDIDVRDNKLTITGLVKSPDKRFKPVYSEYGIGGYTRSFQLGQAIDQRNISASMESGVLTLVLQKSDRLRPRKIAIGA